MDITVGSVAYTVHVLLELFSVTKSSVAYMYIGKSSNGLVHLESDGVIGKTRVPEVSYHLPACTQYISDSPLRYNSNMNNYLQCMDKTLEVRKTGIFESFNDVSSIVTNDKMELFFLSFGTFPLNLFTSM